MSKRKTKMQKLSCENRLLKAENAQYLNTVEILDVNLEIMKNNFDILNRRSDLTISIYTKKINDLKQDNKELNAENEKLEKILKTDSTYFYILVAVFIIQWILIAIIN